MARAVPRRNIITGRYITSPRCSAHANSFENRPLYTDVNHQNGRALTSARFPVSQIVGYSRRCRCRRSRETNIFPRGGCSSPKYALGVWHSQAVLSSSSIPFYQYDRKYRRICGIVGQIELQRTGLCGSSPFGRAFSRTHTHAIADHDSRHDSSLILFDNKIASRKMRPTASLRPFPILSSFSIIEPTPFGIQSVCVSSLWIILAVYRGRADCTIATQIIERGHRGIENC